MEVNIQIRLYHPLKKQIEQLFIEGIFLLRKRLLSKDKRFGKGIVSYQEGVFVQGEGMLELLIAVFKKAQFSCQGIALWLLVEVLQKRVSGKFLQE